MQGQDATNNEAVADVRERLRFGGRPMTRLKALLNDASDA
jgi:hypothetical protein